MTIERLNRIAEAIGFIKASSKDMGDVLLELETIRWEAAEDINNSVADLLEEHTKEIKKTEEKPFMSFKNKDTGEEQNTYNEYQASFFVESDDWESI